MFKFYIYLTVFVFYWPFFLLDSSASASTDSVLYPKKHRFTSFIGDAYDESITIKYLKWIHKGLLSRHELKKNDDDCYSKNKSSMTMPMQFGVEFFNDKNWFYKLSFEGQLVNDAVSIILTYLIIHSSLYNITFIIWHDTTHQCHFYYLHKKAKYDPPNNFK